MYLFIHDTPRFETTYYIDALYTTDRTENRSQGCAPIIGRMHEKWKDKALPVSLSPRRCQQFSLFSLASRQPPHYDSASLVTVVSTGFQAESMQ
jgi:hypothetical protein